MVQDVQQQIYDPLFGDDFKWTVRAKSDSVIIIPEDLKNTDGAMIIFNDKVFKGPFEETLRCSAKAKNVFIVIRCLPGHKGPYAFWRGGRHDDRAPAFVRDATK